MKLRILAVSLVFVGSISIAITTGAEQEATRGLELSPDVLELLRKEMREIATGVQSVPLALATADWASIQETSTRIVDSYIMERSLTPSQASELERTLPEYFKQLDADFHLRAAKLGEAAAMHDLELVAFHFSRLLEACARCHSAFASQRFSGFSRPMEGALRH